MSGNSGTETLRVLMVGHFAGRRGENDGGVSAVMSFLADAYLERDDIALTGARLGPAARDETCDEHLGFPVHNIPSRSLGLATGFSYQRRRFHEIVRRTSPDIVHGQGADVAGFLASRSGRPAIVTVHGMIGEDARYKSRIVDRLRETLVSRLIEKPLVGRLPSLILISPYVADYYGAAIRGVIHDIPNPVSRDYFELERRPEPGRILYAGRVIPRKGIVDLVLAFSKLAGNLNPRLVIAGSLSDKTYVEQVRRVVSDQGVADKVELLGLLNETELLNQFARAQLLVLPSYQETAPMVVIQAMAAGLPVVASRICGIPHQVADARSGFLFTPGDVAALHGHFDRLLSDTGLSSAMGAEARRIAEARFHVSKVAAATVDAYRATIANAKSA
ncbi:MAG: glycosyltransferase family 4 protein [Steroidobacteraceae bacterium]